MGLAASALLLQSCVGDLLSPNDAIQVRLEWPGAVTSLSHGPGQRVGAIIIRVVDRRGEPAVGARVEWAASGKNSRIDSVRTATDAEGRASAVWWVGTQGPAVDTLAVRVMSRNQQQSVMLLTRVVPSHVASLRFTDTIIRVRIGDSVHPPLLAADPFGNTFVPESVELHTPDSTHLFVRNGVIVGGPLRGASVLFASAQGLEAEAVVHTIQVLRSVSVIPESLVFSSLAARLPVAVRLTDDRGQVIEDSAVIVEGANGVVRWAAADMSVVAEANGTGALTFTAAGDTSGTRAIVPILVRQVGVSLEVQGLRADSILRPELMQSLPVTCVSTDANGHPLSSELIRVSTRNGTLRGDSCAGVVAARSGVDTVRFTTGAHSVSIPVAIAVRPGVSSMVGDFIVTDESLVGDPWAPSADTGLDGAIELYFANYLYDASTDNNRADLVRLRSADGFRFSYDGVVLQHGDSLHVDDGRGIENTVIFRARNGDGWRQLYAGGNEASGWQVYGASSVDRRNWVKTGPVISNGYPDAYRPLGEGLVVDELADGSWRLITAAYEPPPSTVGTFSITEWRSSDQLAWSFVRTWLRATDLPSEASWRVVYSPVLRQIGPSMWRLIVCADNLGESGGQSAVWSLVSTDLLRWQIEGKLLGQPGADLFYVAMAKDWLYFIRRDNGQPNRLAGARVAMY